jgi:uncharacterized protein (DUF2237 family)
MYGPAVRTARFSAKSRYGIEENAIGIWGGGNPLIVTLNLLATLASVQISYLIGCLIAAQFPARAQTTSRRMQTRYLRRLSAGAAMRWHSHTVCAVMTSAFLEFSKSRGNDLSTPLRAWASAIERPGLTDLRESIAARGCGSAARHARIALNLLLIWSAQCKVI